MDQRNRTESRETYLPVLGRHAVTITDDAGVGICCPVGASVFAVIDGVASIDGNDTTIRSFDDAITVIYHGVDTGDHIHRGDLLAAGAFIGQAAANTAGQPPLHLSARGADGTVLDVTSLFAGANDPGVGGPAAAGGSPLPGPSNHSPTISRKRPRQRRQHNHTTDTPPASEEAVHARDEPSRPLAPPTPPRHQHDPIAATLAPSPASQPPATPEPKPTPQPEQEPANQLDTNARVEPTHESPDRPTPEPETPVERPAPVPTDPVSEADEEPAHGDEPDDAGDRLAASRPRPKARPRRRLS